MTQLKQGHSQRLVLPTMKQYTEIPDTSDSEYWELKANDGQLRSQTFVPRNKELHKQLKTKAWVAIQAAQPRRKRNAKD